jgi:hypothetical protein
VEDRVQSQVSPCEISGGQSGTGKGFSLKTSGFRCHQCYTTLLTAQQTGEGWEPSKKQWSLGNLRTMDRKEPSLRFQNGDNFIFTFTFNSMAAMVHTGFNSPANITATS